MPLFPPIRFAVKTEKATSLLSEFELERYDRQIRIDGFGVEGQEKLRNSSVLIAGAGGLGCPIAMYLATSGVGRLRIVDNDVVELSNLNRQVLHWQKDIGRRKAESAGEKLCQMNTDIDVEALSETIAEDNVHDLTSGCDMIVDAMDNYATRYILNRTAIEKGVPFFHGSIYGLDGMATTIVPKETACLRCIFPQPPPQSVFPVLGIAPGVIGCIQATEVIKYIVGIGELLTDRLLLFDGLGMKFRQVKVRRDPKCIDCKE